jgi:hypothetical protein
VLLASGLPTSGGASLCDADTGRDPEPEPDAPGVPISNAHTEQWRIYTDKGAALVGEVGDSDYVTQLNAFDLVYDVNDLT